MSSTASRLKRLAAIPEGMMSGFFLTCLFGGCDNCSFCDFGGRGSGLEAVAFACDTAGGGSELCLMGCYTSGGGGGGGDMLLDLPVTGGQLERWWSNGDLEIDIHDGINRNHYMTFPDSQGFGTRSDGVPTNYGKLPPLLFDR